MAHIQDIRALETEIYDAVEEYLDNPSGYDKPKLHVYLDEYEMEYRAEVIDFEGDYPIQDFIRNGEVDIDKVSDIANSYIFLD